MASIKKIYARQIIDSRGEPTIEVDLILHDGAFGRASVPAGASTGKYEAIELRDGDDKFYFGKSVLKAVNNVNEEIDSHLHEKDLEQSELDSYLIKLDGTENKSRLGANAILGVSLAYAKARAHSQHQHLFEYIADLYSLKKINEIITKPAFNIMNGGRHANWSTDFQEYWIIPQFDDYYKNLEAGCEIYQTLEKILEAKGLSIKVGNEGGFAPKLATNTAAFDLMMSAIEKSGYKLADEVFLGADIASSEFYDTDEDLYKMKTEGLVFSKEEWLAYLEKIFTSYPVKYLEDPFNEDDFDSFALLTKKHGDKITVIGDDLLVTNPKRIHYGVDKKAINGAIIKMNQIGTLTETLDAMKIMDRANLKNVVSHRSGETEDVTISHLAVGTAAPFMKFGAPSRSERTAKYNELIRIAEYLRRV